MVDSVLEGSAFWWAVPAISGATPCLSGRPARTQYVMDIPRTAAPKLDDLYTPEAAERLNILRHQIEIAQGRAEGEAA